MVRRKELKNVARGIVESFNSRNNDVDGYWGIGKLFQFANFQNVSTVQINLTNGEISPSTNKFLSLVNVYQAMLKSQLKVRGIPSTWIVDAHIEVSFNQVFNPTYHTFRSKLGLPCVCICTISDDYSRVHIAETGNNCFPHDPSKECRRSCPDY